MRIYKKNSYCNCTSVSSQIMPSHDNDVGLALIVIILFAPSTALISILNTEGVLHLLKEKITLNIFGLEAIIYHYHVYKVRKFNLLSHSPEVDHAI